jgi:hypothetical protein
MVLVSWCGCHFWLCGDCFGEGQFFFFFFCDEIEFISRATGAKPVASVCEGVAVAG